MLRDEIIKRLRDERKKADLRAHEKMKKEAEEQKKKEEMKKKMINGLTGKLG